MRKRAVSIDAAANVAWSALNSDSFKLHAAAIRHNPDAMPDAGADEWCAGTVGEYSQRLACGRALDVDGERPV
jgi:hypothetical protein